MNFKNLSFIKHPNINDAIMAQVICNNGKRVSVVAGKGMYSTSKEGVKEAGGNRKVLRGSISHSRLRPDTR